MKRIYLILPMLLLSIWMGAQQKYLLENETMQAKIDPDQGTLTGLHSKMTGWDIIQNKEAGCSFEANIKLSNGKFYVINASSQERPEVTKTGDSLTFVWKGLNVGDKQLDVTFTGTIAMRPEGLIYGGKIENNSDAVIEQLTWPFIGEISIPANTQRLLFQYMNYTKFNTEELYPQESGKGWSNLPEHSFTLINNTKEGLYLSSLDHNFDEYIRCEYETVPTPEYAKTIGTAISKQKNGERKLMRTRVRAARMLYLQAYSNEELVPFIITPYTGTWHKGVDIYKKWRKTWFVAPHRAEWLSHVNSWQQLQINSSESRINFKFKDLHKYVDECKRYGVDAIQLTGWTKGGQDRGLPSHDVDPRLGTAAELKKAIADASRKGVKILLFTKFTWADLTTDYHKQYLPDLAWNAALDTCIHPGYNYNTYTQLEGVNTRRFGIFCMASEDLRKKLRTEFQKCLDLGAPGMVYDENQHHAGAMLCFNPNHGHKIPGFVYKGANQLGREFLEMCKKSNPDFLMTGEGPHDILGQYYATYTRADYSHDPVQRYVDSELPIACAIIDHNDKNHINMCAADRYAISYEVRNFKGNLSEFPRVMAYGQKVDQLRRQYEDFLWHGEFQDILGANVTGNNIKYTVFRNRKNGKKAVVAYNVDTEKANMANVSIEGSTTSLTIVSPENQSPVAFSGNVEIGPQSMVVIIEK